MEFTWSCAGDEDKMSHTFKLPKIYDPTQEEYSVCYAAGAQNLAACALLELLEDEEFHNQYSIDELAFMSIDDLKNVVDELGATEDNILAQLERLAKLLGLKNGGDEITDPEHKLMWEDKQNALLKYKGVIQDHLEAAENELKLQQAESLFDEVATNPAVCPGDGPTPLD